jgi:hypothetical protein
LNRFLNCFSVIFVLVFSFCIFFSFLFLELRRSAAWADRRTFYFLIRTIRVISLNLPVQRGGLTCFDFGGTPVSHIWYQYS